MPRRVNLPGANELFRATQPSAARPEAAAAEASPEATGLGTGRVRHDEKITVYVSSEELLALEAARLEVRRLGITADRGRIVRAAIALAITDLAERGEQSDLAERLRDR